MEFGLSFLPDSNSNTFPATNYYKDALALSKFADESGFKTVKMTEHYLHEYGGYCPSPLMFLASVAAITKNIRLMTGCILPAFHHPIQIAAETAQLDAISMGRLDVGFARAYLPYEFSAFEIDMNTSRERYEQTISAVKTLWTEKNVSINSDFFRFSNVSSLPLTTQKPYPPIWGAAVNSRQSFAWLGEQGHNLLVTPPLTSLYDLTNKLKIYRESFVPNEVNKKPFVAISLPLLIRNSQQQAVDESDYYLSRYMKVWSDAADSWNNCTSNNYPGYTGMSNILRQNTPQKMRDNLQALIGSPELISHKINQLLTITQVDQILFQVDTGGQDLISAMNTLLIFTTEVMPLFKGVKCYDKN